MINSMSVDHFAYFHQPLKKRNMESDYQRWLPMYENKYNWLFYNMKITLEES